VTCLVKVMFKADRTTVSRSMHKQLIDRVCRTDQSSTKILKRSYKRL